jgi:tRNA-Thr(GGU) m(6)t(6)A37 methyltransferase TsaA
VIELTPIGRVESELTDPASAPKQGREGAPDAWLVFEPAVLDALEGIGLGAEAVVLTWLDRARRDVLRLHPRDDPANPLQGVFNTRSADRPNPIGLHPVEVASVEGARVRVRGLEAIDAFARAIVDANRYMTLATADERGQPWVSPVWYAPSDYREFLWVSDPNALHSRNVAVRPQLSIVIFDSQQPIGTGNGVYMAAVAEELTGADLERGVEVFSRRSEAQGARAWTPADVTPPARHRLYRATATEHWVLGAQDERLPVAPATGSPDAA